MARMNLLSRYARFAKRHRWFLMFVVIPVLLSGVYLFLIASDEYVSESRFAIKAPNQRSGQVSSFANLIQTTGLSAGQEQANEVIDFVRSRSALQTLVESVNIGDLYGAQSVDFLSRYPRPWEDRTMEDLFDFYRSKVVIDLDPDTGLVVLRTRGYSAEAAETINEHLLQESERLVNELNEVARTRAISEAEDRVVEAEQRLAAARRAVAQYRNTSELVDPLEEAAGVIGVANELVAERASIEAELSTLQRLTPDHPSIPALRQRIASLDREIRRQTARLAGPSNSISGRLPTYDALVLEQELSSQLLVLARTTLEQARTEALKQQFYLERVVEPNVPDAPEYPHALTLLLTILGFALCVYFIVWMFVVGILEHAPED
jgi:capsular polysaccharide transport system permease protein